jgi:hypothetical protein
VTLSGLAAANAIDTPACAADIDGAADANAAAAINHLSY